MPKIFTFSGSKPDFSVQKFGNLAFLNRNSNFVNTSLYFSRISITTLSGQACQYLKVSPTSLDSFLGHHALPDAMPLQKR